MQAIDKLGKEKDALYKSKKQESKVEVMREEREKVAEAAMMMRMLG